MRQDHKRILLHDDAAVRKALVQLVTVLVDDVAKGHGDISQRDDDVTPDVGVFRRFENLKQ